MCVSPHTMDKYSPQVPNIHSTASDIHGRVHTKIEKRGYIYLCLELNCILLLLMSDKTFLVLVHTGTYMAHCFKMELKLKLGWTIKGKNFTPFLYWK